MALKLIFPCRNFALEAADQVYRAAALGAEAGDGASAIFGSRSRGAPFLAHRFRLVLGFDARQCALGCRLTRILKPLDSRYGGPVFFREVVGKAALGL